MKVRMLDAIDPDSKWQEFTCEYIKIKNHEFLMHGVPCLEPTSYRVEFQGIDGTDRCMSVSLFEFDCYIGEGNTVNDKRPICPFLNISPAKWCTSPYGHKECIKGLKIGGKPLCNPIIGTGVIHQ